MIFSKEATTGICTRKWGDKEIPRFCKEIEFKKYFQGGYKI